MCAKVWISRDYLKCSGCRRCEIECSLTHEKKIWPEASRVRVFMLVPTVEVPHLCSQCSNYPCISSCPVEALSVDRETGAVIVDKEICTACGNCIDACPGRVPNLHPTENYPLICDLCNGDPACVKACHAGGWDALRVIVNEAPSASYRLYARRPKETTKDLLKMLYGEFGEGMI